MSFSEHHLGVRRTARYYLLGDASAPAREIWVACHGYGQLAAAFAKALAPLDDGSRVVVVPEALSRFYLDDPAKRHGPDSPVGATWMTREDRESEIADYVAYLDRLAAHVIDTTRSAGANVVALGFSQGVATVCRWAALGEAKIDRLILWGGTTPPDLPRGRGEALFRGATLTLVAGRTDKLVGVEMMEGEQRKLREAGLHSELVLHDGGHSLSSQTLRTLAANQ